MIGFTVGAAGAASCLIAPYRGSAVVSATPRDRCSSHVVTTKPAQAGFVVTGPQVQYSFCDAFGVILSWARPTGREITNRGSNENANDNTDVGGTGGAGGDGDASRQPCGKCGVLP